jgi:integrase
MSPGSWADREGGIAVPGKRGNNEGSISKRIDSLWEARITLENGQRKSFYAKTRQEAARKLAAALRDQEGGLPVVSGKQTVGQYLTVWLDATRAALRPKTWRGYEQFVRLHIAPAIGSVGLVKLTPQHVQLLYAKKLEEGLSSSSVHHLHAVLHRALDAALRLGLVQRNVCDIVEVPRMRHYEMTTLSEEQAQRLLNAATGERLEALYVVALATGMRQGELLALTWRDVDLESASLHVRSTVHVTRDGYVFAEPKTKYSRRAIALSPIAVSALRSHRVRQVEERLRAGQAWEDLDLVFPNSVGRPIDGINLLKYWFYPLLERAGLPRMRFHDLRHTAATLLLGRGVNPKIVSEMLGHSHVSVTLGIYSHVLPHMQREAAKAMNDALGG